MKKCLISMAVSALMLGTLTCGITASAATVDDVAAEARRYGYSEDMIQQGYNIYYAEPDKYTSEDFDAAIEYIHSGGDKIIDDYVDPPVPEKPQQSSTTETQPTTAQNTTQPYTGTTDDSSAVTVTDSGKQQSAAIMGGITEAEFIAMTYEEKREFMSKFSYDELQVFISSLTPEMYKSMMAQLPADKKLAVVDDMANAGDKMGINVTVDDINDDSMKLILKDDSGKLVGVASAGIIVEDTGYDHRGVLLASAGLLAAAVIGIAAAFRMFRKGETR